MVTYYEVKGPLFVRNTPRLWSDQPLRDMAGIPNYDLAPDGKRFAIIPALKAPADGREIVLVTSC